MSMARTFRSIPRPASAEFSSMWLPSSASKIVLDKPPVHPLPSVAHAPPLAYGPPLAQLQVEQHDDDKFNARVAPDTILREDKDPVDTMTGEFKAMGLAAGGKLGM